MLRFVRRPHVGGASSRSGLTVLAVVLVLYFQYDSGNFTTRDNMIAILSNTAPILLASIAAARLVIAGAVDLSIGGIYAVTAVVGGIVARDHGTVLAVAVAIALGAAIGAFNGVVVRLLNISPIIVTIGLAVIYRGFAQLITNARSVHDLPDSFLRLGRQQFFAVPIPVYAALVMFVIGSVALTRSVGGVRSYAVGGNPTASRLVGIRVDLHRLLLFVYLGASVGLVALLSTARLGSGSPTIGTGFEIDVLTAVVLGGVAFSGGSGRPIGVFVGVITIGILNAGMIFIGLTDFYQQIAKGTVLLAALAADQALALIRRRRRHVVRSEDIDVGAAQQFDGSVQRVDPVGLDEGAEIVLEAAHLAKSYGSVVAVADVELSVRAGEVLCLLGDNGAGKTTVIKMLSGAIRPSAGTISVRGKSANLSSPAVARAMGIETVHQDLALCENLGAAHNLVLGREPRRWGFLGSLAPFDRRTAVAEATERLASVEVELEDLLRPVSDLSGGQRQIVAIARVVRADVSLVILDEPTAALGVRQTANVLRLVRRLATPSTGVVMISHDVQSVLQVSDRIVVLRRGRVSHEGPTGDLDTRDLVHLMAGLPVTARP